MGRRKKSDIVEGQVYETYSSAEIFEKSWINLGGGRHPIKLSDHEYDLIVSYRAAEISIQRGIDLILKLKPLEIKIPIKNKSGKTLKVKVIRKNGKYTYSEGK